MDDIGSLHIAETPDGVVLRVKAVPGSSRDRIAGVLGDCLKVAVSAPAEKGKANKAIASLLAQALDVPTRDVNLLSGQSSPRKEFLVMGIDKKRLTEQLKNLG